MATKRIASMSSVVIASLTLLVAVLGAGACSSAAQPTPTSTRPLVPVTEEIAPALTQAAALAAQTVAKVTEAAVRSTAEAATRAAQPTATPAFAEFVVTSGALNVRSGPGTAYPQIGQIRRGETYRITGQNKTADWWQFSYDGKEGWVTGDLVSVTGPTQEVAVVEVSPPPTPKPQIAATPRPAITARVAADTLNVRSGPGTIYPKQAELRRGDRLTVLERDADEKWLRVRTPDGNEGWVSAEFTDLGSAVSDVPLAIVIPPTPKVVARPGMIAFKSSRGGIWIMNADGSNQQPLANTSIYYNALRQGGPEYCARNGLYCVKADWGDGCSNMDIYVEDREYSTGWHKIVSNSNVDWDPRIHPEGWWVVFVTNRNGNDELFLINRQAGEERRLTVNNWEWDKHPTWSPDGKLIAFFSNRVTGRRQIWILDPWLPFKENVNPHNISNNRYVDYEPVWLK